MSSYSSYLSSLVTTTTSRYASLRALLPSSSENDGDTEDDTHVCRVLRAYYVEKGRPFPGWLPPDPKAPQVAVQPIYSQNQPVGAGYGGLAAAGGGVGGSKLGSLWGDTNGGAGAGVGGMGPQTQRQGGRGASSAALRAGLPNQRDPYNRTSEPTVQARPLPSQRAGTYQTAGTPPGSSAGAGTAQDRLKARLWGAARNASPGPGLTSLSTPSLASSNSASTPQRSGGNVYDRNPSYGSSGGGSNYEDSFTPSGGRVTGVGSGGSDRPFVAATSPWATNEGEFSGAGYAAGGGYGGSGVRQGRTGLPGGPAARKGPGLPSGPRGLR